MKQRVLITGGTGNLGSDLRRKLVDRGYAVRILSRRPPEPGEDRGVEWAVAQLVSGEGVREAVRGVDVIVHTASSPFPASVEIDGGRHLIDAAEAEKVDHFIYVSIIGVERIGFFYYTNKRKVERMITSSGLDYSILRAAQFHTFVAQILAGLSKLPVVLLPRGWQFQPVSAGDVADVLTEVVKDGPQGWVPPVAGPQVLTLDEMWVAWKNAEGSNKPVFRIPVPGGLSKGFRAGHNLAPDRAYAGTTWADYLAERIKHREVSDPKEARAA